MINRIALTLVFTLSFLSYMAPELSVSVQLAPLVLFAMLVYLRVFLSDSALRAVGSLFAADGLLFVIFIPLLTLGPSLESTFDKSLGFWALLSACLILARLYMTVVPIREVLEAYFWSGILSVGVFISLGFAGLMESIETLARFTLFSFHANLLAFLLAGYFCVMLWKVMTGGWGVRIMAGLVGLACLVIIFFASSRGSIVAILAGITVVAGMAILRARKDGRRRVLQWGLLAGALVLMFVPFVQKSQYANDAFDVVDQVLQLSSEYRGIDTGFTGRYDKWKTTMRALSDGRWLLGRGIRSSDSMEDNLIDNGYLVMVYEIGLLPLLLVTWRFLSILRRFLKGYFCTLSEERREFYLVCSLLMIVFLVNNIVARYLFGVGNPYSLLALCLFATPTSQTSPCPAPSAGELRPLGRLANRSASSIQASS